MVQYPIYGFEKNLWMYWHQGFENAPEIVNLCIQSWKKHNPDWTIHLLNQETVNNFIELDKISKKKVNEYGLAHHSDLIRTKLLIEFGGVWADATCFCLQPLDNWLPNCQQAGLFLFCNPGPDRIISNWFIASEKDNYFLKRMYTELCNYWENNSFRYTFGVETRFEKFINRYVIHTPALTRFWFTPFFAKYLKICPYFVYHYKFYDLICSDMECHKIWKSIPRVSAKDPHILLKLGLNSNYDMQIKSFIVANEVPLFKLSWKKEIEKKAENSIYNKLIKAVGKRIDG